ncbi:unnamed protein product [Paramecium sonneborni]|uniref:Uncharacterized protein n=1 Tax=Paramecium sonneborni TaxID=65129 RepID=A0A8S1QTQ1_9CILI|nr:unnamed protein product [Paramecium sonneborni]
MKTLGDCHKINQICEFLKRWQFSCFSGFYQQLEFGYLMGIFINWFNQLKDMNEKYIMKFRLKKQHRVKILYTQLLWKIQINLDIGS